MLPLEILAAIALGLLAGTLTGLIPGLHINLVALILFTFSPIFLDHTSVIVLSAFVLAMSITHTFTDFIASVYLGVPEADTALSVLPGHKLLLEGKAYEAIRLTLVGSLLALLMTVVIIPLLVIAVPKIFEFFRPYIAYLLIVISLFMILREPSKRDKAWASITFFLAGLLGVVTLNLPGLSDPLFPLLSGLFGVSMLLTSLSQSTELPIQRITEEIRIRKRDTAKAISSGVFSGSLLSVFPGLGPAQAAILASQVYRKITDYTYLILVGGINTVTMVMSLVTLLTIDKARNGSIIVVQRLLPDFDVTLLLLMVGVTLITGGLATFITLLLGRIFTGIMNKVNYAYLSLGIIALITALAFYFSGFLGVFILALSTSIGILPNVAGVGRNHAMGVLLLPIILYFLL